MIGGRKTEEPGLFQIAQGSFVYDQEDRIAEYKAARLVQEKKEAEMNRMRSKINNLEEDISDIKQMLKSILGKMNNE